MKQLDVVVAIVSYKSASLTIDCLQSIVPERAMGRIHIRAIVVDNASGDSSAIAEAIAANSWSPWVTLIQAPRNGGFAYGNNLAIQQAYQRGPPDYFHLLNPDTVIRPGAISALAFFLEDHPKVGIAGSSFENLDRTDWPIAFRFPSILSEVDSALEFGLVTRLLRRWVVPVHMTKIDQPIDWVSGASMMVRREVFDAIGGFDEGFFLYFEETDFCRRANCAGFSTWYIPESRVMHIAGQSTRLAECKTAPKRLPAYWFESRRRYFIAARGPRYAAAVDILTLAAYILGACKRLVQRRTERATPYFFWDLLRYSALWPKNRRMAAVGRSASYKFYPTNQKK